MKQSLRMLLDQIVDYAGLFPPASLAMVPAVKSYAAYRTSAMAWMLGRFVVPVARLAEFAAAAQALLPSHTAQSPWRLSALAGPDLGADLAAIAEFNQRYAGAAVVDALELKANRADAIATAMRAKPGTLALFFEIPIDDDPHELVAALAETGARAKVRAGGVRPEMFPATADLARFLHACVAAQVPFKATAGLHHPVRSLRPLTYAPDSPTGRMFGFLNVFLAAALLQSGTDLDTTIQVLEEIDPAAFQFDDGGVTWRGRRLESAQLAHARACALSFGSCSFGEPVDDLRALGLL
jgi:hypothetical protein